MVVLPDIIGRDYDVLLMSLEWALYLFILSNCLVRAMKKTGADKPY